MENDIKNEIKTTIDQIEDRDQLELILEIIKKFV